MTLLDRLRQIVADAPAVVAHRGDSASLPENTLPAFAAAVQLGAPMLEFDVQSTADGALVCLHDDGLDRTTDAPTRLGPGALVRQVDLGTVQQLDAGRGARVPTLEQALATMLPRTVPMIEHKGGEAAQYVDLLRSLRLVDQVLLQSFDWQFVAAARALAPDLLLGLLGPTSGDAAPDDRAFAAASAVGAAFLHWRARSLTRAAVDRIHAAGLLCFSYTTDDELGWHGGAALGIDGMCTNQPAAMLAWRRTRH